MKKEKKRKDKAMQSILFICLSIGTIAFIVFLWDFLINVEYMGRNSYGRGILFTICFIPVGLLFGAIVPWIKFEGFKGECIGGQLMHLDDEGCYLGPLCEFDMEVVNELIHIFDRESDYRYERFTYSQYAIYIKTTKGGQWFFPDKTDSCLIMTGQPGGPQLIGFKISEDESRSVEKIIKKYDTNSLKVDKN